MITLKHIRLMQEALSSVLESNVFLRKALHLVLRQKDLTGVERAWVRDTLYRSVQLKNRYRTIVEKYLSAFGSEDDQPLDIYYFIMCQFRERRTHLPIEDGIVRMIQDKAKVRKFTHFLDSTPVQSLFPSETADFASYLWLYHSHPLWMIRKWLGSFTRPEVAKLCLFNNALPDVSIRVNPAVNTRDELMARFREEGIRCAPSRVSPLGVLAARKLDPLTHPGYKSGQFTLQNLSSQLVSLYVNPKPGQRILDYCAGEGGKTLLLAHLMKGRGEVFAHDNQMWRLRNLQLRMRREGISNIRLEGLRAIRNQGAAFDLVLVDAPCSGSGFFRHQPELKWKLTPQSLQDLNLLQLRILDEAAPFCRPGGLLFYVTCSLFVEENHKVVRRFLGSREGWELVPPAEFLAAHHRSGFWITADVFSRFTNERYFQILPHRHGLPGMFCAVLRRGNPAG